MKDFRGSWSDGMAFCAIIHSFLPDKIPYDELSPSNPRQNFTLAFQAAKYVLLLPIVVITYMPYHIPNSCSYYIKATSSV